MTMSIKATISEWIVPLIDVVFPLITIVNVLYFVPSRLVDYPQALYYVSTFYVTFYVALELMYLIG